jgi:ribosomal protein S18 acetylase RimI-like enzyme
VIEAIERSARLALPALTEVEVPGWVIRVSGGPTKRVNSANPMAAGARLVDVRATADRLYRDRGLPPRYRLTPLAEPDADMILADEGHARIDDSRTMTTRLSPGVIDPDVTIAPAADAIWLDGLAAALGWSAAQRDGHAALVSRVARMGVATLFDDGEPVGWGIAGFGDGRACLYDIALAADRRGQGLGQRLVGAILAWVAAQGAGEALLQVLDTNEPARRLYRSLGFVDAYPYHYRIKA